MFDLKIKYFGFVFSTCIMIIFCFCNISDAGETLKIYSGLKIKGKNQQEGWFHKPKLSISLICPLGRRIQTNKVYIVGVNPDKKCNILHFFVIKQ